MTKNKLALFWALWLVSIDVDSAVANEFSVPQAHQIYTPAPVEKKEWWIYTPFESLPVQKEEITWIAKSEVEVGDVLKEDPDGEFKEIEWFMTEIQELVSLVQESPEFITFQKEVQDICESEWEKVSERLQDLWNVDSDSWAPIIKSWIQDEINKLSFSTKISIACLSALFFFLITTRLSNKFAEDWVREISHDFLKRFTTIWRIFFWSMWVASLLTIIVYLFDRPFKENIYYPVKDTAPYLVDLIRKEHIIVWLPLWLLMIALRWTAWKQFLFRLIVTVSVWSLWKVDLWLTFDYRKILVEAWIPKDRVWSSPFREPFDWPIIWWWWPWIDISDWWRFSDLDDIDKIRKLWEMYAKTRSKSDRSSNEKKITKQWLEKETILHSSIDWLFSAIQNQSLTFDMSESFSWVNSRRSVVKWSVDVFDVEFLTLDLKLETSEGILWHKHIILDEDIDVNFILYAARSTWESWNTYIWYSLYNMETGQIIPYDFEESDISDFLSRLIQ